MLEAAVHAYTEALRAQLDGTGVEVAELERDGTYDDLVAQRSQALAMLPSRR